MCVLVLGVVILVILLNDTTSSDETTSTTTSVPVTIDTSSGDTSSGDTSSGGTSSDTTDEDDDDDETQRELWTRSCDLDKCKEATWSVGDIKGDIWGGNCKEAEDYLIDCSNGKNATMHCPAYVCDPSQYDCLELKDCGGSFNTSKNTFSCGTRNIDVSCADGSIITSYKKYKA